MLFLGSEAKAFGGQISVKDVHADEKRFRILLEIELKFHEHVDSLSPVPG